MRNIMYTDSSVVERILKFLEKPALLVLVLLLGLCAIASFLAWLLHVIQFLEGNWTSLVFVLILLPISVASIEAGLDTLYVMMNLKRHLF